MDDPICYELREISIATGTFVKCYSPKSFLSFKASLELYFSRIMHVHMLQRLFEIHARDPCPAVLNDELLLRLQAIWSFLPQADAQNLFDSMPRRIAALIATRGGYTKY
ncbi:uncharacterized protein TNCV_1412761 [Trichonephila clavipes]|nr:uncharacterized protein TNCV_1412761 [Trichonephila clavipes]